MEGKMVSRQPYTKSKEVVNGNQYTKTSPITSMDILYTKGQNPIMPNGMYHLLELLRAV
jgi:hypothetical protein